MSRFFSLNNIALIWVTTIIIKSIHELGHGLTCKHFGGEVHEVGVMLLVFTPYFFVNVSDSWVLPDRNKRILISAAGIYVELVLASLATFLWAVVQPGPLQQILWNIMVIASISTIIFNANPADAFRRLLYHDRLDRGPEPFHQVPRLHRLPGQAPHLWPRLRGRLDGAAAAARAAASGFFTFTPSPPIFTVTLSSTSLPATWRRTWRPSAFRNLPHGSPPAPLPRGWSCHSGAL